MNRKQILLAVAVVLAACGWWFARSAWRTRAIDESRTAAAAEASPGTPGVGVETLQRPSGVGSEESPGAPRPGQMLRPPDPIRRFTDFTPEQRVEFARKGHGPGG